MEGVSLLLTCFSIINSILSFAQIIRAESGHRFMALLPRPKGSGWGVNMANVDSRLEWLFQQMCLPQSQLEHRRGKYPSLPAGVGFGGGRTCPGNYANSNHNAPLIDQVLADPAVQLMARFVDCALVRC